MKIINWFVDKFLKKHIDRYVQERIDEKMHEYHAYFHEYIKDLNVITATDMPMTKRNTGFMVLLCKVKDRDFMKIIPLDGCSNHDEWRNLCRELTGRFGARHMFLDSASAGRFEREILHQEGLI